MNREFARFLGFLAATAALGLVIAVLGSRFLGQASGPDGAIVTHLKKLERDGVELQLRSGELLGPRLQFERISITMDANGEGATVTSTLDFTGELRRTGGGAPTKVSSLGLERARYLLKDGEWVAESTDLPRLSLILETLEQRRVALDHGEVQPDGGQAWPGLTHRVYSSLAWYIRSEREDVVVSEDYRLEGRMPDRPVDEKATRRLSLHEDSSGLFSFPDGIL
jgi:hypothetical protein